MLMASPTRRPTPVALSNTSRKGTPPQNSKIAFSPSRTIPKTLKSQTPKSAWASAGAHPRCRNSFFARLSSDFLALTYCCTVV